MSETEYKAVRGLIRGLALINGLNRIDGGASTAQLAELSGLHRTTVRRLLETLQAEGYVRRSESDDSYRLTLKVRELSEGFRDEQWISSIAAPLLGELLQQVVWPTDLCTLDGDAMVIRETTHRFSRLSFHRSMVGRRLPLLMTATGRAYFAYCSASEREELIDLMLSREDEQSVLAADRRFVERLVEHTVSKGYGENNSHWGQERRIAAIAIPVVHEERVMGCLNLVYIAKAMSVEEAARRYLPAMRVTVQQIQERLHA
ncbi:DNA-binding transcriptional regulator [Pseudomonas sp. NPDC096917]|uniref:DNA-binding transcriptional regulator n=1 Tax=Pseudomonas sp. NPDC096917 TaxID=3364483 RepID=UPI00383A36E2